MTFDLRHGTLMQDLRREGSMTEPKLTSRDVLLQAEDIERASAFYENVLGLSVFLRQDSLIGLEAGAFRLFLDKGAPCGPVFEVFVDDLDAARSRLIAAGCRIEQEDPAVPKCYVRDPFGLIFNIAER
jgi:catechol 2,3-dioxygenase-like lactoylglutathione lyase family enzyme